VFSLLVTLCACTSTVPLSKYENDKNNFRKSLFYEIQGDALTTIGILNEFRGQRPENGIELLEFEIDNHVSLLWNSLEKMDESTRSGTMMILNKIKEYRKKYPRVIIGSAGNDDLQEMVVEAKEEAEKILKQL